MAGGQGVKEIRGAISIWTAVPVTSSRNDDSLENQQRLLLNSPFARIIMAKLFAHPKKYGFSSADEVAEALLHYSGRLMSILRKSLEIDDKKDAYIDKSLRFIAKSVQRYNRKKDLMDSLLANSSAAEGPGLDAFEATYLERYATSGSVPGIEIGQSLGGVVSASDLSVNKEIRRFIGEISPSVFTRNMGSQDKRLLFLTIKCAWEVDDAMAQRVARRLGLPALWLETLLHKARATLETQRISLERLMGRINETWGRILYIESELRSNSNLRSREELEQKIAQQRSRYYRLLARKARMKPLVTHKDIAFLLGLPKGSIDSGLFYLKEGRGRKLHNRA
jgi:hypothetical protein